MAWLADVLIIVCARGATVQARVLEGAELLVASAGLADVLFVTVGTIRYGARYTCCSSGVGLLVIVASEALERISSFRTCLAVRYAIGLISTWYTLIPSVVICLGEGSSSTI